MIGLLIRKPSPHELLEAFARSVSYEWSTSEPSFNPLSAFAIERGAVNLLGTAGMRVGKKQEGPVSMAAGIVERWQISRKDFLDRLVTSPTTGAISPALMREFARELEICGVPICYAKNRPGILEDTAPPRQVIENIMKSINASPRS